jgi:nucleotide-binding universal stress UspA family protein
MKILLAIDGSSFSEAAVEAVARRPWPAESELKIISVVEPLVTMVTETWVLPDNYWQDAEDAASGQAREALDKAAARFPATGNGALRITTDVLHGYPKRVILDEAEKWGADLVMVGSHGYSGFKRLLLGSVSQAVASHAKCSVEIVRSHPGEEGERAA